MTQTQTPHLQLPYIAAAQAQKHITHNEALRRLDALVQLTVLDDNRTVPPADPAFENRHIIAAGAVDDWSGHDHQVAIWQDGAWAFYPPAPGWRCWVDSSGAFLVWNGTLWQDFAGSDTAASSASRFGIQTEADETNRLSVKSDAVLLSHDDVTPGTGDIRLKLNKAASGDTASLLFQDGFSGRAEMGLAGDDDFHIKVSPDGQNWSESMVLDKASGAALFPQNNLTENLMFNLFQDAGRFAGSPEPQGATAANFTAPSYLSSYNGSSFTGYDIFINNNGSHGGSNAILDPLVDDLMTRLKSSAQARRYGPEFWVMTITAGTGTASVKTVEGVARYLLLSNRAAPIWAKSTWGINLYVQSGSISLDVPTSSHVYLDGVRQYTDRVLTNADGWIQLVYTGQRNLDSFIDYDSTLFRIRAEPSSVVQAALPFLVPAQIIPKQGKPFGRISSLTAWG